MEKLLGQTLYGKISKYMDNLCEIRIRKGKPVYVFLGNQSIKIDYVAKENDIENLLSVASNRSVYAVSDKLVNGFLPYGKGVRIGLCGEWIFEKGKLLSIKNYSSLNVRLSKEIRGCSSLVTDDKLLSGNTLIVSPPCGGKTTFLRDLIFRISQKGFNVSVIDERGELWANGGYDLGDCTDVITGAIKKSAFSWAVRTLSPHFVAMDELVGEDDYESAKEVIDSGVKLIATVHGRDFHTVKINKNYKSVLEKFQNVVELSAIPKVGTVKKVLCV